MCICVCGGRGGGGRGGGVFFFFFLCGGGGGGGGGGGAPPGPRNVSAHHSPDLRTTSALIVYSLCFVLDALLLLSLLLLLLKTTTTPTTLHSIVRYRRCGMHDRVVDQLDVIEQTPALLSAPLATTLVRSVARLPSATLRNIVRVHDMVVDAGVEPDERYVRALLYALSDVVGTGFFKARKVRDAAAIGGGGGGH
jgi:hypothetical protein